LDDGVHILSIKVNDSLGNGSEKNNIAFLIDKSIPELTITDAPKKAINGAYTFKGTITKTINVKKLTVKLGNDEIITIDKENNNEVTKNKYGVSISVDQTPNTGKTFDFTVTVNPAAGGLDDGPKSLMFSAVGSSGQSGMTTSSFTLDTKGPSISIGAPLNDSVYASSNTEWSNLKNASDPDVDDFTGIPTGTGSTYDKVFKARIKDGNPTFTVTFTDAASSVFEVGNNTYWYKFDDGSWTPGTSTDYGKTSVSVDLPLPSDFQKDGIHRLSIRVKDSLGNGYNNTNDTIGAFETGSGEGFQSNILFMIDTGVPVLVVKNSDGQTVPSADAEDYGVHNKAFTISGTITGTFDVQDLSVKIGSTVVAGKTGGGGAAVIALTPKSATSKRTYNFTGVNVNPFDPLLGGQVADGSKDGSYTVSVTVKGSSEQSTMNVSTFTLDTQGPKITINAPIKEKIYLTAEQRSDITGAISANKISTLAGKSITLGNTPTTLEKVYYDLLRYNVKDASSKLSGGFADTYSDVGTDYWYSFNGKGWTKGETIITNAGNLKSKDWEIDLSKLPNGTLNDGMNRLSIRVKDALSNGYADTDAAPKDDDGGNGFESNLNFIFDTGTPDFTEVSGLSDTSVAGKEPDVKGPSDIINVSGQITDTFMVKRLSVSVGKNSSVILTNDGVPTRMSEDIYIENVNIGPAENLSKTFDYSFDIRTVSGGNSLEYGSRTITVNATGSSDYSAVKTVSFIFDNKGPTVSFSVPSKNKYMTVYNMNLLNTALDFGAALTATQKTDYEELDAMIISDASAKLSGTFNDDYSPVALSGKNTFWYNIDYTGWKTGILPVSTNKSVGWEIDIKDLTVGIHTLSLRVKDSLGNGYDSGDGLAEYGNGGGQGYETNIVFLIDKNPPEITEINVPKEALKDPFTVTGKVTKTYGVKKLSVKLGNDEIAVAEKKNDGSGEYIVTPKYVNGITYTNDKIIEITPTSGVGKSFDFKAYLNPVSYGDNPDGLKDGPKSLTFTAIGSSGQADIGVDSFTLDTTGPAITVGAPINNSVYVEGADWTALKTAVDGDDFSGASSAVNAFYDKLFDARIKDNKASFTVTFTDDASDVFKSGKNTSYWYMYEGEGWKEAIVPATEFDKKSVSLKLPMPVSNSGLWKDSVHRLSIRVKDSLGNGYDNSAYSDTAISKLEGDGKNNYYGHETYRTFMIDSGKPEFKDVITELGTISSSESLSISGSIIGTFRVEELNAKIGSSINNIDLKSYISSPANSKKTYNFTAPITTSQIYDATSDVEGSYTVSLTVKGSSELSDTKVGTFILDTIGPEISINSPIREKIYTTGGQRDAIEYALSTNVVNSLGTGDTATYYNLLKYNVKDISAGLSGSFTDKYSDIGDTFWYKFGDDPSWTPVNTVYSNINNKKSTDWNIPLTGKSDGLYSLSIRVKDGKGNGFDLGKTAPEAGGGNGYESDITFLIDTAPPEFADVNDLGVKGPSTSSFKVVGQITDTYMIKRLSVSLANGSTVLLANDTGDYLTSQGTTDRYINGLEIRRVDGAEKTFEYSFNVYTKDGFKELQYGSRSITVSAVGSSEQSTVKILPFIYDNEGPRVAVNMPIKEKVYLSDEDWNILKTGGKLTGDAGLNYNKISSITDANNGLNGYFNDDYSKVGGTFWYQFPDDPAPYNEWQQGNIIGAADKSVAWNIPLTNPASQTTPPQSRGDGVYRVNIRVMDEEGNGYNDKSPALPDGGGLGYETNLAFIIDMGIPEFTNFELQRADGTKFTDTNVFLNGTFKVAGTIEKVLNVQKLTVKIGANDITSGVIFEELTSSGMTHDFTIRVPKGILDQPGNGEKSYTLSVTATTPSGQSSMALSNFTYDKTAPTVTFNSPSTGTKIITDRDLSNNGKYDIVWSSSWETGSVKVGGVANDGSGIDKIYYHLGKLSDHHEDGATDAAREANYNSAEWIDTRLDQEDKALNWTGGVYYWNYTYNFNGYQFDLGAIEEDVEPGVNTSNANQFYLPMYVKVVDRAGNIRVVQYKLFIDPDKDIPQATITYPDDNAYVGGAIRITGGAKDNDWVHSVEIRVIDTTDGSYYFNRDGDGKITDTVVSSQSDGWVRATFQGNVDQDASWYHSINVDGRLNPASGKTRPVRIEVRAVDTKDPLHQIPDKKGSAVSRAFTFMSEVPRIETPVISKTGIKDRTYTDGIKVSGQFKVTTDVKDVGGLSSIKVRQTGMSGFTEIVKDGEFTNATPPTGQGWTVTPPTKVLQSSWKVGYRYFILNKGTITNWQTIDKAWFEGKKYDVDGVMIQYKGGANGNGAEAYEAAGIANDWDNQYFVYKLEFSVDSTVLPSLGYGRTGLYNLELQAYNNNQIPGPYNTNGTYTLGIDNFYPSAEITTQYNATTSKFYVMGTAKDYDNQSGSQMGIARVLVYFERNGTYYNARAIPTNQPDPFYNGKGYTDDAGKNWSSAGGISRVNYPNVRDMTQSTNEYGWNTASFANFPYLKSITKGSGVNAVEVWESPHAMVIDGMEIGETVDSDEDGTFAEQLEGRGDVTWQALFDTTKFGDGPITVHYVIMDQAGNATHYAEGIYIGNNRPLIRSINLGTDFNANGTVTAWTNSANPGEYLKNPITVGDTADGNSEIATNFIVRNSRLAMRLDALFGNGTKRYRISYVTRDAVVQSTAMVRGNVYTINSAGNTDWTKYGAFNNNAGTTFVASGSARPTNSKGEPTTGTAQSYKYYSSGTELTGNFGSDNYTEENEKVDWVVTSTPFTAFSATSDMKDSTNKEYDDTTNKMTLKHDKLFIVKVYDTTTGGGELDQLARVALINMDFDNQDTRKPRAVITPFHWTSASDNSLYQYSKDNGHIELEAQTNGRPKVSGQISVRGTVTDNNIIGSLWARMENLNFTSTPAGTTEAIPAGGSTYYRIANFNATTGKLEGVNTQWTNGWSCAINDPGVNQDGHSVSYQLDIDTSKLTNVVGNDVVLRIVARDYGSNTQDVPTLSTAASALTSQYNMDIVPYISGVEGALHKAYSPNPTAFSRSAQGWYPVREDEVITIRGFNFRTGNTAVRVNDAALGGVAVIDTKTITARVDNDGTDNNQNTITSGPLVVRVTTTGANYIDSINNSNVNNAEYNKEGNGLNNDNLTDDRNLYVWNVGSMVTTPVTQVFNTFFRMDNNANRLVSYGYYNGQGTGRLRVNRNGTDNDAQSAQQNKMVNTTVAVTDYNAWYAAGSDITAANPLRPFYLAWSGTTGGLNNGNGSAELKTMTSDPNTYKIPRIAVQRTRDNTRQDNNGDRIFMSHFDTGNNEVTFRIGGVGASAQNGVTTAITVANDNTKYKGSVYTAVGYLSNGFNGKPVIAWYDRINSQLIFSYGNTFTSSTTYNNANFRTAPTTQNFQDNAVVIADFKGPHVDMAVDGGNNVHLAYYDVANGGLWYTYIPVSGTGGNAAPDKNNIQTVRVDTYLSAGTKIMINVRQETVNGTQRYVPYISYAHASFGETRNSIRVAWRTNFTGGVTPIPAGCNDKDAFTGDWEVMTVPVSGSVIPNTEDFVCNGVPTGTGTNNNTLSGWNSQTTGTTTALRGYWNGTAANATNLINKSILVGYMTDKWYEGAVLKKQIF